MVKLNIENRDSLNILLLILEQCGDLRFNARDDFKRQHEEEVKDIPLNDSDDDLIEFTLVGESEELLQLNGNYQLSVIGELQALEPFLAGYISRLSKRTYSYDEVKEWITGLENYNVLALPHVQKWYIEKSQSYPLLRFYIDELDYLRLKLIEYLKAMSAE